MLGVTFRQDSDNHLVLDHEDNAIEGDFCGSGIYQTNNFFDQDNPSSFTDEFKRNLMGCMAPGSTPDTRQPHLVALCCFFSGWIC